MHPFRALPVGTVLRLGLPLALAASGHALRIFIDRLMLSWHSGESIRAAMTGGLMSFLVMTLFIGIGGYSQVLASHQHGAGERDRIGLCVWQGLWVALAGALVMAAASLGMPALFHALGHEPAVAEAEAVFSSLLLQGGIFSLSAAVLSGFWAARGATRLVMAVSLAQAGLNALLNHPLIFGWGPLPGLGIAGSAIATVTTEAAGLAVYLALFLRAGNRRAFATWPHRTFDRDLFLRLVRFGAPQGIQFLLSIAAFNAFVLVMAAYPDPRVGEACTLAFGVNAVAFIPCMGFGRATSILVGQACGARRPDDAVHAVHAAALVCGVYGLVLALWFAIAPHTILAWFTRPGDAGQAEAFRLAELFLLFVAAWTLFDGLWQLLGQALQGAGDTRWTMRTVILLAWTLFVPPVWLLFHLGAPAWGLWAWCVGYILFGSLVFARRWRSGHWRSIDVLGRGATPPRRELAAEPTTAELELGP